MKERPILFNGAMVRAILSGAKSQTRRALKMPHGYWETSANGLVPIPAGCPFGQPGDQLWVRETFALQTAVEDEDPPFDDGRPIKRCPPVQFGGLDPLWTQPHYRATDPEPELICERTRCAQCRDNEMGPHWRPSIHMPRWACRLVLEITDVRVERLQAISEADCRAEGLGDTVQRTQHWFRELWTSTGGDWDANPWVWVISFKRIEA